MHYIIMDLEWNNTFAHKTHGFINEIIEIGAVKLDESLNVTGEFSQIIKSQIGKRLRSSVKNLTHITNDDLKTGVPFIEAVRLFKNWMGDDKCIIMTWGDGDIRVFIENFRYLHGTETLSFMSYYEDVQRYFELANNLSTAQQISLLNAAALAGINTDNFSSHRALDDSRITAECFRRCFRKDLFESGVVKCDEVFYKKLSFKPHPISNINSPLVDKKKLHYTCSSCGKEAQRLTEWKYSNQFFRALFRCPECGSKVRVAVRFKKFFDRIEVKTNVTPLGSSNEAEDIKE